MLLVSILIMATAFLLAFAAYSLPTRAPVRRRLARLADGTLAPEMIEEPGGGILSDEGKGALLKLLEPLANAVSSAHSDRLHRWQVLRIFKG